MFMENTQFKIRIKYTLSEAFEVRIGLKQGDSLSPTLFNIALRKAIRELQLETTGVEIGQQHIQVLSFADELNILGNSLEETEKAG
jgi:NTP pyrophosphatase (non-canonical NTP hydrolase)